MQPINNQALEENSEEDDAPDFAPIPAMPATAHIPSMGLW